MGGTKLMWWGYRHINGTLQVKRFFDYQDLNEARESDFVEIVSEIFEAENRQDALEKLAQRLS